MAITNLKELLTKISEEFPEAYKEPFKNHQLAQIIRKKPKGILAPIFNDKDLFYNGGAGQGRWTKTPWIAIIDTNKTTTAQHGIYVVYLFSEDMKRIYLTLNQGVTKLREKYGIISASKQLLGTAKKIQANYQIDGFISDNKIEISTKSPGKDYENSTIFHKDYKQNNIPPNETLINDLKTIVSFYKNYTDDEDTLTSGTDFSKDPDGAIEGKRKLKKHYIRERNRSIIKKAKQKRLDEIGELRCDVCNFSFSEKYNDIDNDPIEAHHLKQITDMKDGDRTKIEDLALLCPNCHRIIHSKNPPIEINKLKKSLIYRIKG